MRLGGDQHPAEDQPVRDQAEEAARFYTSLLPDSRISRVQQSPVDTPGGPAGSVLL
ncbi:VOC family protein, partial [Hansschlegelia beijingensis]